MGGFSEEREISLKTGNAVVTALTAKGYDVDPIVADWNIWKRIKESKPDVAFIALHGPMGEDGAVQGLLEWMGVPYAGSGILGSAIALNKTISKKLLIFQQIPTPGFASLIKGDSEGLEQIRKNLNLPCVVKPASQGSTIGLTVVRRENRLQAAIELAFDHDDEILVEDFIDGRLLAVGVLGERTLPIVEIIPKSGLYDYEAKYTEGKTDYVVPAPLNFETQKKCEEIARQTHKVLRCNGFSRVDIILDREDNPMVLELNSIPGMTKTSLLPMAAKEAGMDFGDLLENILGTVE